MKQDSQDVAPKDFFISYNNADRAWAEWVAWQLEEAGFSVVIQAWDFRPGSNFMLGMHKAAEARRTIAVLSPNYLKALYTQPEWAAASVQDPTGQQGTLLPIRIQECDLSGLLKAIIYIDLVGQDEQTARTTLLAGVDRKRARPTSAPYFPGSAPQSAARTRGPSFPGPARTTSNDIQGGHAGAMHIQNSGESLAPSISESGSAQPVKIFVSYVSADEARYKELAKHLKPMERDKLITVWYADNVEAGLEAKEEAKKQLDAARIILLLVSPDFLVSDYHYDVEMARALERHHADTARVIPIILRHTEGWEKTEFHKLQALPRDGRPVKQWADHDAAFSAIAKEIRGIAERLKKNP